MLVPGDYLWSASGMHVCDENGFVITVKEKTIVKYTDVDKYCYTYQRLANERINRNITIGYSNVDLWIAPNNEYILPSIRKNTLLVPHPTLPEVYMPKTSQCGCSMVYAATAIDNISFDIPWVPKKKEKIQIREEIKINKVFATSNVQEVIYDEVNNRYVIKTTEIEYPVMELVDIYDESGKVVLQKEMQKVERVIETVQVPVLDENKQQVMEIMLDENNQVIMIPEIPERYFDGTTEITYENYKANSNATKAILIPCSLINAPSVVVTQTYVMSS